MLSAGSTDGAGVVPGAGEEESPGGADPVLRQVAREVEAHVAASGWDQPARLYALVPTSELMVAEPGLAAALGLDEVSAAGTLTPVEQDEFPADRPLEDVLAGVMWPSQVVGCAAVVERLMLPPQVEAQVPSEAEELVRFAAEHPERQDVRMAAAVTRNGRAHCALRLRAHDGDNDVLDAPDLVPALVRLLAQTLVD